MAKKLVKKQDGGTEKTPAQVKEARRDSLYKAHKAKTDSILESMRKDVVKVNAPNKGDTARVKSVRITVANKKSGGQTNSKKK